MRQKTSDKACRNIDGRAPSSILFYVIYLYGILSATYFTHITGHWYVSKEDCKVVFKLPDERVRFLT